MLFADWLFQYEADLSKDQISPVRWRCYGYGWKFNLLEVPRPPCQKLYRICRRWSSLLIASKCSTELQRLRASDQEQASRSIHYPEVEKSWNGFELLGVLGQGAISRVFLARQTAMSNRVVALKLTPRETSESQLLARIQHSGVVPIFSVHHQDGLYGVCMPYMGSTTLSDLLEAKQSDLTTDP